MGNGMILPREDITSRNLVENLIDEKQLQQAGIDLTVATIHKFTSAGTIDFSNEKRVLSNTEEVEKQDGKWILEPGAYKIKYNEKVTIPNDCAALCFPRSTLLRCGCYILTALWDPGYVGRGESTLIVQNPHGLTLYENARVAQLIYIKLTKPTKHTYDGIYNEKD